MNLKRVYELKKGDIFKHMATIYIVYKTTDKNIFYRQITFRPTGSCMTFGAKSKMKVEIIDKETLLNYYY